MAIGSLAKDKTADPALSREEMLTRQFYGWEKRGRGWDVRDYPVELEPPFRPVFFYDTRPEPIVDDGQIPTFWSKLFGGSNVSQQPKSDDPSEEEFLERIAELDEPIVCDYYEEEFHELQIVLSKDRKIGKPFVDQLVTSAAYCTDPIAFEVVGTPEEIVVQMAATSRDLPQVRNQLLAYFPEAQLRETEDNYLERAWEFADGYSQIVDFGLSNEFMVPLKAVSNLELDPLVSIVGALTELEYDEVGVFQVLFQKARSDWATEIMDSVRFADGTPVFSNAPEMIPHAKQKLSSPLYAAVVRVAAKAIDKERVWRIVRGVASGMAQLTSTTGNELIPLSNEGYHRGYHEQALLRRLSFRCGMLLNLNELVSLVHPPSQAVQSEKLVRADEKTKAAPALAFGHPLVFGSNEHENESRAVTLSDDQRTRHLHLIGSSGSGKSTLLLNLIKQDMERGHGLCVIDPHGDLIDAAIANVPDSRIGDVILFDPSDAEHPIGFNILQAKTELEKTVLSSDLTATFRRMSTSWGDVMDTVLANAILALVESSDGGTLFDLKRFLVEKDFREEFLHTVGDDTIRYFWTQEFPLIANKPQASILIRLDAFLRQKLIRNIVCQKETKLNFREIMDGSKILLIKLSQGLIGEENAYLLGTMLVSRLYQAALSRQDSENRPCFWLYMDEFHHFITPSMERILSGTRKYNLGLTLAHQEFRQMQSRSQEVASSVLSNCYTRVCFRLGDADAEKFAGGFSFFDTKALQNLGVGEAIARVERADYDFNMTIAPVPTVPKEIAEKRRKAITDSSRTSFSRPKADVQIELQNLIRQQDVRKPTQKSTAAKSAEGRATPKPYGKAINTPSPTVMQHDGFRKNTAPAQAFPGPRDTPSDERGTQHRYLQSLVKRMAENKGFRVAIEKQVFGGVGRIDVALENDTVKIACEISVTNEPGYELQNLQKCLTAGYDHVVIISTDERHLNRIKKTAKGSLATDALSKIEFLTPDGFHQWLENTPAQADAAERVKGFKVNLKMKAVDETERSTRKKAISEIVFGALKKLKNRPKGE